MTAGRRKMLMTLGIVMAVFVLHWAGLLASVVLLAAALVGVVALTGILMDISSFRNLITNFLGWIERRLDAHEEKR